MRKFWLENEIGERIDLFGDALFLEFPSGLGFAENNAYSESEYGFHELTDTEFSPAQISGELVFKQDAYQQYREVMNWIARSSDIKLIYLPYGQAEYYIDVSVGAVEKTELSVGRRLRVPIQFTGLTPWYSRYPLVFAFTDVPIRNYKRYGYRYECQYTVSGTPGRIDASPISGHFAGGISLYAAGALAAPVLTLKNTDTGEVYGKLDLSGVTINEDEQLIYSSKVRGAGVWRQNADGLTDLIDQVELHPNIPVFMRAPINVPLTFTLDVNNVISSQSTLYIYEYWKTR